MRFLSAKYAGGYAAATLLVTPLLPAMLPEAKPVEDVSAELIGTWLVYGKCL